MEEQEIEKRDLDLLNKLRLIRKRNQITQKNRARKKIILTLFFISLIVFFFFHTNNITNDQNKIPTDKTIPKIKLNKQKALKKENVLKETFLATKNKSLNNLKTSVSEGPNGENISLPVKDDNEKVQPLLQIAKGSVCSSIKNRIPKDIRNIFYLKEDKYVFVWTEIWAKSLPTSINHTYYLNGKKYCAVSLKIKYPRMRTWSKITLNTKAKAGLWKVNVTTEDGKILKQMAFKVKTAPDLIFP